MEGAVVILVDTKEPLKVPFSVLGLCMPVLMTLPRAHEALWDTCRIAAKTDAQAAAGRNFRIIRLEHPCLLLAFTSPSSAVLVSNSPLSRASWPYFTAMAPPM